MKASTYLWESLEDKEYGSSASPEHAAFRMAHGMHIFPYYVEHVSGEPLRLIDFRLTSLILQPRGKRFGEVRHNTMGKHDVPPSKDAGLYSALLGAW